MSPFSHAKIIKREKSESSRKYRERIRETVSPINFRKSDTAQDIAYTIYLFIG